jgi:hypothetical protein
MTHATNVAWRATFKTTVLDYFTSFFPISPYRDLQIQAMVRIPITIAEYAIRYVLGKTNQPLSSVCMLNVKEFWDIWEGKSQDLLLEMSQRIDALNAIQSRDPPQDQNQVQSPPIPLRTNISTETLTPPEEGSNKTGVKRTFDDLSPITQQEEAQQPWRAPDIPFPTMEPPKWSNHCIGWYERNAGGKIYWRSRIPVIDLENIPSNLSFIASHWTGRILPDGTMFLGNYSDGRPSFGPPTHTDHTRKGPEASRTVPEPMKTSDQVPPTQRSDPVVPRSDHATQPTFTPGNRSCYTTFTPGNQRLELEAWGIHSWWNAQGISFP